MRVLLINVVCGVKSTGRICTDLADILLRQGHEVRILYGRENVPEKYKDYSIRIGYDLDVYFHAFMSLLNDSCGFHSKLVTKRAIRIIEEFAPDVIHLHNLHGYYINLEYLFNYLKELKKRVIWTLHDCWAYTGHCAYYSVAGCELWRNECYVCGRKHSYPKSMVRSRAKFNFKKKKTLFLGVPNLSLVTPSDWLANQVSHSFLKTYSIRTIPNGIDTSVFTPTESDFRTKYHLEDKIILLGVATAWGERKGLKEFCTLAKRLDEKYKLVLVGLTKTQMEQVPEMILKIKKTNSSKELAEIYTAADVFLNLGKEETMGLTTVEAMACGTPVLVSNLTAVPEVVTIDGGIVLKDLKIDTIMNGINSVISTNSFNPQKNAWIYRKNEQYMKYLRLYGITSIGE